MPVQGKFLGNVDTALSSAVRRVGCVSPDRRLEETPMVEYEARSYPTICPYLYYEDAPRALDWLVNAFGFTERMRATYPDGRIGHCELAYGDSVVMVGSPPEYRADGGNAARFGLYVHVDDVDAHHARALAAGARVQEPPTDQEYGVRSYGVLDCEGNQWWFAQPKV
jgi:uncharacterized glyoxalase superfamily protein PhnB